MATTDDDAFAREHEERVRGIAIKLAKQLGLARFLDDMIGFGFQGLYEARDRFDPGRGAPFGGFAYYRIRGAILNGLRGFGGLPWSTRARIEAMQDELLQQAAEEIDERPPSGVEGYACAFDALFGKLTGSMLVATMAAEQETPEDKLLTELERARVRRLMATLPEREHHVLRGVYLEDKALDTVGDELGVSRSRASRLHTRALGMMRAALG